MIRNLGEEASIRLLATSSGIWAESTKRKLRRDMTNGPSWNGQARMVCTDVGK